MSARKPPSATKGTASSPGQSKLKMGIVVGLFTLVALGVLMGTGVFSKIQMGPRIPIMRDAGGFNLGTDLGEITKNFPKLKKELRPFNNDPLFRIVTVSHPQGDLGPGTVDLIFYKDSLYFISCMWQGASSNTIPFDDWVKQSRRWKKPLTGKLETLGGNTELREWHFNDGPTEMILRDLRYPKQVNGKAETMLQRWQDIRDASNGAAQELFAKYRLDNQN